MNNWTLIDEYTNRMESTRRLLSLLAFERAFFQGLEHHVTTMPHISAWNRARQDTAERIVDIRRRLEMDREWLRVHWPTVQAYIEQGRAA